MLNEFIKGYNSLKIKAVNKLGDGEEGLLDELDFLDDSLIASKIRYIKKVAKLVDDEINTAPKENLPFLIQRKEELSFEFAFLASNSIRNIDFCLSMLSDNDDFKVCLYGLKEYDKGNNLEAVKLFSDYFKRNSYLIEHYLICKVYGELLYAGNDLYNSSVFLRKAVEKRPDEISIHVILRDIYLKLNDVVMAEQENEILKILGV